MMALGIPAKLRPASEHQDVDDRDGRRQSYAAGRAATATQLRRID